MRIAVISDIHGNQIALEAVLADLKKQPAIDQIVIAGDLCLNGPCPKQVLTIVQQLNCPVIKGNVDEEVVTKAPEKSEKKRNTIAWTREQIGQAGIDYLDALPLSYRVTNPEGSDALIVHANPRDLEDAIFPTATDSELEHLLSGLDERIGALAFGHLHTPYIRLWRRILLVDVASCGIPRDEDLRAAYAVLTWCQQAWDAEIRRVEYDVTAVVKQIRSSGMPNVEKRVKTLLEARY